MYENQSLSRYLLFDYFGEGKVPKYIEIGGMIDLDFPIQIHSYDLVEVLMRPLSFNEFVLDLLEIKLFLVTYRRLIFWQQHLYRYYFSFCSF